MEEFLAIYWILYMPEDYKNKEVLRGFVWVNIYHIVTPRFNEGSMSSLSHIYLLF